MMGEFRRPADLPETLERAKTDPVQAYAAAKMLEDGHWGQSSVQYYILLSARGGYPPAMLRLAGLYFLGQYMEESEDGSQPAFTRSPEQGACWLKRAADTGDQTACYLMARCLADGIGVKQDLEKAERFLKRSALPGNRNPYEPVEVLIFGGLSPVLRTLLVRVGKRRR